LTSCFIDVDLFRRDREGSDDFGETAHVGAKFGVGAGRHAKGSGSEDVGAVFCAEGEVLGGVEVFEAGEEGRGGFIDGGVGVGSHFERLKLAIA